MKKIIFSLLSVIVLIGRTYGQTDSTGADMVKEMEKMFGAKITMEVDTTLYNNRQGNFYISENPQAMLMAVVIPDSYENSKLKLSEAVQKKEVTVKDLGEMESNGKKIIYKIGEMKENGQDMIIELYAVEATTEKTILITGVYLPKDKLKYANSAKKAALKAKLD